MRQAAQVEAWEIDALDRGIVTGQLDPQRCEEYKQKFTDAMDDDFSTSRALAAMYDLAREINLLSDVGKSVVRGKQLLEELADILGLTLKPPEQPSLEAEPFLNLQKAIVSEIRKAKLDKLIDELGVALEQGIDISDVKGVINWLKDIRDALRKDKQWQLADEIRNKLAESYIVLEDTPRGTVWKYRRV